MIQSLHSQLLHLMKKKILMMAIILTCGLCVRAADVTEAAAQQAVAAKHFTEAREIYRQLLRKEPENLAYQNWVARLSAWLKEYDVALAAYDLTLARQPENFEAVLGKAYVRMWQRQFHEAEVLLEQAALHTDQQLAWNVAMFSLYSMQGKLKLARQHLDQVRVLDPQNAELPELEKQLVGRSPLTVQFGFETQRLQYLSPDIPAFNAVSLDVVWRRERDTLGLRVEKDFFGETQIVRTGWSFSHRVGERLWLRGGAIFGSGAKLLPQRELSAGAAIRLKGEMGQRFILSGDYRRVQLSQATAHVLSPTVEFLQSDKSHWQATVFRSWQPSVSGNANSAQGISLLLKYDRRLSKNFRSSVAWTQVRQASTCGIQCSNVILHQSGLSFAASYQLNPRLRIQSHYGFLRSGNGARQNVFGVSLAVN
jgi:tetratricopeptide (TPR) repeat protein